MNASNSVKLSLDQNEKNDHIQGAPAKPPIDMIKKYFNFDKHNTNLKQEILAGLTTFVTMAYIIIVNPAILQAAGIPFGPSMVATILSAAFGTLIMGVYAKRPFAIAPYMGENALIAYTVVQVLGYSWQIAFGAVFLSGLIFIILTITRVRGWLVKAIPMNLKYSFTAGIGLFLTLIGMNLTGIVTIGTPVAPLRIGHLGDLPVLLALFCFILIATLMIRKIKGAILIGIIITTFIAFPLGSIQENRVTLNHIPLGLTDSFKPSDLLRCNSDKQVLVFKGVMTESHRKTFLKRSQDAEYRKAVNRLYRLSNRFPTFPDKWISSPPSLKPIFLKLDILGALDWKAFNVVLIIFIMAFVDTIGTLIGLSARANLLDHEGNLPQIEKPMMADALTTTLAPLLGTITSGAYMESISGIEAGGRSGFTAVVTALLFLSMLFFSPFINLIPPLAYGPALMMIGVLMLSSVTKINFQDNTEAIPAFAVIVLMSFTYNIGIGITGGFILYPFLKVVSGRAHEIHPGLWVLAGISLLFFFFYPYN